MTRAAGDDRSRLLRALGLSRRFHLFLAYVESPRAADQLVRALQDELPRLRKAPVDLVRLDPYEGRESDAPLEEGELADRILIPLLSPPEERRVHGVVHVVDASRAAHADTGAWGRLFALWNEKRNALQQLGGEVLVVLPEWLKRSFATSAPDVWSIRSGEYAIGESSALEAMNTRGSLGWYRAIPPLALFGGDLLITTWINHLISQFDVDPSLGEPETRGPAATQRALDQRALRRAEHALAQRRFAEAESTLRPLLSPSPPHRRSYLQDRAIDALLVALAAQDRVDEALARDPHDCYISAYLYWCAGRLGATSGCESGRIFTQGALEDMQTGSLQFVERGDIATAKGWTEALSRETKFGPRHEQNSRLIRADHEFLTGGLQQAATSLGVSLAADPDHDPTGDEIASAVRADTLAALVELARGDRSRAVRLLNLRHPEIKRTKEPEAPSRVLAFHAYASGLLQADGQNPEGAVMWFTRARAHIAEWSRTGLDRRSLHRASLAVDLAHATLDPTETDPVGVARRLVERGIALLGDTAEDFIARVLTVEARRELARRLADKGDDEAAAEIHRALDLARPLGGRGVPAWDAILAATERDALTLPMR